METRCGLGRARSRLSLLAMAIAGVMVGELGAGVMRAEAAWPTNGIRAVSGIGCDEHNNEYIWCPFMNDSQFQAADNTWIFGDYNVNGDVTAVTYGEACFERYYGDYFACNSSGEVTGYGPKDNGFSGFQQFFTSPYDATESDYFWVLIGCDDLANPFCDSTVPVYGLSFAG